MAYPCRCPRGRCHCQASRCSTQPVILHPSTMIGQAWSRPTSRKWCLTRWPSSRRSKACTQPLASTVYLASPPHRQHCCRQGFYRWRLTGGEDISARAEPAGPTTLAVALALSPSAAAWPTGPGRSQLLRLGRRSERHAIARCASGQAGTSYNSCKSGSGTRGPSAVR